MHPSISMKAMTLVCAATMILGTLPAAHAFSFGKKLSKVEQDPASTLNVRETPDQTAQTLQILQALAQTMTQRLQTIEAKIAANQTKEALTLAKEILDEVRIKTGIDPKAKLRQNFLVAIEFPENATNIGALNGSQQEAVIKAVRDFRGGLYLDILNLSKRTSLLYIKAFHAELNRAGGLTNEDRNKIIKDLAVASIVPMPVQDKTGKKITVFDDDVANEDHIYLFNREIKMYLLNAKDLSITESQFDKYKAEYRASLAGTSSGGTTSAGTVSNKCLDQVAIWVTGARTDVGILVLNWSTLICSKNNNFDATADCVTNFNTRTIGRPGDAGINILKNSISACGGTY